MTRTFLAALLLFTAPAAPMAGAADQPPGGTSPPQPVIDERGGLTLEAAIARALAHEPSLRAVRASLETARGLRQQAGLWPNPAVSVERRVEPAGSDRVTSVGVEWPLDLFRRAARERTADRGVEASRLALADRERRLVAEVRRQYGVAAALAREAEVAGELAAAAAAQFEVVRGRAEAGRIPPLDRDVLDVDVHRLDALHVAARGRTEAAMVALRRLLGMAPEEPLRLRDTIERLVGTFTAPPAAPSEIVTRRPDVLEADARVTVADARVEQARRDGRLDASVFAGYMHMDAGFPQQGFGDAGRLERVRGRFHYWSGGARITMPLFNRNQGQVAAAVAERSAAEARRDAVGLTAQAEVAAATIRADRAREVVALYTDPMRALARRNLDVVRETFDLGRATMFDVLGEQRRYWDLEQGYTAALGDAWAAWVDLALALGEQP